MRLSLIIEEFISLDSQQEDLTRTSTKLEKESNNIDAEMRQYTEDSEQFENRYKRRPGDPRSSHSRRLERYMQQAYNRIQSQEKKLQNRIAKYNERVMEWEGDVSYLAEQRDNLAKEVALLKAKCTITVHVQDNRDDETRTVKVDVLAFDSIECLLFEIEQKLEINSTHDILFTYYDKPLICNASHTLIEYNIQHNSTIKVIYVGGIGGAKKKKCQECKKSISRDGFSKSSWYGTNGTKCICTVCRVKTLTKKCQGTCKEFKTRDCFSVASWAEDTTHKNTTCICTVCRNNDERSTYWDDVNLHRSTGCNEISKPIGTYIQKYCEAIGDRKMKNKEGTVCAIGVVELIKKHHTDWSLNYYTADNYKNTRKLIQNYKLRNQSSWNIERSQKKPRAPNGTVGVGVKKMNQKAYEKFLKRPAKVTNAPSNRDWRARGVSRFT